MITDSVLNALATVYGWFVGLLPDAGGEPVPPAMTSVTGYLADVNSLVPIDSVVTAAVFVLAFLVPMIAFRLLLLVRHVLLP